MEKFFDVCWEMLVGWIPWLDRPAFKQFVKFGLVGVTNTAVDLGVYVALTRLTYFWGMHLVAASVISFSLAATWSYYWNKLWTFQDRRKITLQEFSMFFLVSIGGLLIHAGVLWFAVNVLVIYDLLGKVFAVILSIIWNFFINRYWTFRHLLPGHVSQLK